LTRVAYHEAALARAHCVVWSPFDHVMIVPEGDIHNGHVLGSSIPNEAYLEGKSTAPHLECQRRSTPGHLSPVEI
jgi:hypothetical protein